MTSHCMRLIRSNRGRSKTEGLQLNNCFVFVQLEESLETLSALMNV